MEIWNVDIGVTVNAKGWDSKVDNGTIFGIWRRVGVTFCEMWLRSEDDSGSIYQKHEKGSDRTGNLKFYMRVLDVV